MLEHLFGSRTRVKLLRLFSNNPEKTFFVRELTRKLGEQINSVRRELMNLEKIGFLSFETINKKKYYRVKTDFFLYQEIKALILKSRFTLERVFVLNIKKLGSIQYLALCGYFVDEKNSPVDLLIVGRVNKTKLASFLEEFSRTFGQDIRYTVMDTSEYKYRKEITDKFLYSIINGQKIVVINKMEKDA